MVKRGLCNRCFKVISTNKKICNDCSDDKKIGINVFCLKEKTLLYNRYIVGKVIGYGGFGITYVGYDKKEEKRIAIKEYFPRNYAMRYPGKNEVVVQFGKTEEVFKRWESRFLEEARILSLMNRIEGVVSVQDFFYTNGTSYMVMEFINGMTFKDYLEKLGGKISFERCCELLVPVMRAIGEVHKKNLLHRDISPENIMITINEEAKIIDFGAARYKISQASNSLSVILKEGYAPIEQYRSKGEQGPWTDIYAFGATIYRAITGEEVPEALERGAKDTIKIPSKIGIKIKREHEKILMKALAVKPKDRYQCMYDILEKLAIDDKDKNLIKKMKIKYDEPTMLGVDIIPYEDTKPKDYTKPKRKSSYKWIYFTMVLIIIILFVFGFYFRQN
jgi:serine/threonine protein kinase